MASAQASCVEWQEFAGRHPGHPFLQHDPLYALTERVIDSIQTNVPQFFTPEEEEFERDLAHTVDFGFFQGHALGLTANDRRADPCTGLSFVDRHRRSAADINETLEDELRQLGFTEGEIDEHQSGEVDTWQMVDARKSAYAGWLISNHYFRDEVNALRASWEPMVQELGTFPSYPRWPFHPGRARGKRRAFLEVCYSFYRRWGLDRMLTWDWPVPLEADLGVGMLEDLGRLSTTGVVIFVPWYLLRGERLDLRGIIHRARNACQAKHLWPWLQKPAHHPERDMGDIRFEGLLSVYRYHELVLARRYERACRGRVQQLDRALATVMERDEDTVKKLRLELRRALRE